MLARRLSSDPGSERLRARRRRLRRRALTLLIILALVLAGAFVWLVWQPFVRVSQVAISGGDPSLASLAKEELVGTYFGGIPRDSIFFPPKHDIRAAILAVHPELAAVSVARSSLTSLLITLHFRVAIARWCGLMKTPDVPEYCYLFDAAGFIYRAVDTAPAGETLNSFVLYDPLEGNTEDPLHATLAHASQLPAVFDFARQAGALGSAVIAITIKEDEVDDLLASGTRLTYVLRQEVQAFTDLTSARTNLNLADGSLEYVDLRFPGKVYFKKKE